MSPKLPVRWNAGIVAALIILAATLGAQISPPPTTGVGVGVGVARIRGFVFDSVHQVPLANAVVMLDRVPRIGQTDAEGRYTIDSIPPGSYRLYLVHPILDTIGLVVMTAPVPLRPGESVTVDVGVPSGDRIVGMRCPAAMLAARGPGALIGQVIDPDSLKPAVGAKVQLLYEEPYPLGLKSAPKIREAVVDSGGSYKICGLPTPLSGKLQVFRNGVSSGQVEVRVDPGPLGLRSLSIAAHRVVATIADSGGRGKPVLIGSARLTGKVLNKAGRPIEGARVSIEGSAAVALSKAGGDFVLDSLPAGTQSVEVRKLGYGATDQPVELSGKGSTTVTVVMNTHELPAVRVEASRDQALADLGYVARKKTGLGHYLDGDRIRSEASHFSDVIRGAPMLRVTPGSRGRAVIQSARDPAAGCVNFIVDGSPWKEMSPGDIDDYLQPSELRAIEVYNPSSAPAQFETSGSTNCATVVIWTVRSTNRVRKK